MSHSPLSTQASPSIELLNTWLDDRKATRHPSLTIVDTGNEAGWTVKTTNDIERGTVCKSPSRLPPFEDATTLI